MERQAQLKAGEAGPTPGHADSISENVGGRDASRSGFLRSRWRLSPEAERWAIVGLVLVAIVLRIAIVSAVYGADPETAQSNDAPTYENPALALLEDGEFNREPGSSVHEFVRTPGYPAFVAGVYGVFGESVGALLVVQSVLGGLTVLLAVLIARRLTGSGMIGLGVGALVAFEPFQVTMPGGIGTEQLAAVLTALAIYCGVRFVQSALSLWWGVAFGVSLAAVTYVRPTTYYFPVLLAGLFVLLVVRNRNEWRRFVGAGAAVVVPCVVLLGMWNVRNQAEVGSWRFSGIEGVNSYWYRAAGLVADRDGVDLEVARVGLTEDLNRDLGMEVDSAAHSHGTVPPEWEDRQGEYFDAAQRSAVETLAFEPLLWARQVGRGVYSQLAQSGWKNAFEYLTVDGSAPSPVLAVGLLFVWGVEGLALVGMGVSVWRRSPFRLAHVVLAALIAYAVFAQAGPDAAAGFRFRAPLWPIWCLYACIGTRELAAVVHGRWANRVGQAGVNVS